MFIITLTTLYLFYKNIVCFIKIIFLKNVNNNSNKYI